MSEVCCCGGTVLIPPMNSPTAAETFAWTLGTRARRWVLALHLLLTALLVGGLAAMLLLPAVGDGVQNGATLAGLDRATFLLSDTLVTHAAIAFVFTGLAFSLGTPWGFLRFRWIIAKWLLLAALGAAIALLLTPTAGEVAALTDALLEAAHSDAGYVALRRALWWQTSTLLLVTAAIIALSVFKPGRARHPPQPPPRQRPWVLVASAGSVLLAALLSLQAWQLHAMRAQPVAPVDIARLADGRYEGAARDGQFSYRVRVELRAGRITGIDVLENRQTRYAQLAQRATAKVPRQQRVDIGALSGATTTSKVLLLAIADALRRAPR